MFKIGFQVTIIEVFLIQFRVVISLIYRDIYTHFIGNMNNHITHENRKRETSELKTIFL